MYKYIHLDWKTLKRGDTSRYKKGGPAVKEKTKYYTTEDNRKTTTIQVCQD